MDPTLQSFLAALAAALVTGGALTAFYVSERQRNRLPHVETPQVDPGVDAVLSVLRSSALVLDDSDVVLKASAPTYTYGLVRGDALVVPELLEMLHLVRRDGQIRQENIELPGRDGVPARSLTARVAPLGTRQILALVEDRTRERRVEAVRRDFVANVSHELKTPVGAIRLLAEAVIDAADDPEAVQRFAGRMMTESDRLTELVQQIIELSRLQSADPMRRPEPVALDAVVAEAIDKSNIKAQDKQIKVVASGSRGLEVLGSADQVLAAISNLISNAVAYSDPESRVVVALSVVDGSAQISVVDQGIGIPQAEIDRIFERFYRVDPARHRSTGGTGLGLSIVKHVAATHGGDVSVWSVEGEGSTFTLTLPLREPAPAPATPARATSVPEAAPADPQEDRP